MGRHEFGLLEHYEYTAEHKVSDIRLQPVLKIATHYNCGLQPRWKAGKTHYAEKWFSQFESLLINPILFT